MTFYILHYSIIDDNGELSIFCNKPYKIIDDAIREQNFITENWAKKRQNIIKESIGNYIRISQKEELAEIQSCIEVFDI